MIAKGSRIKIKGPRFLCAKVLTTTIKMSLENNGKSWHEVQKPFLIDLEDDFLGVE